MSLLVMGDTRGIVGIPQRYPGDMERYEITRKGQQDQAQRGHRRHPHRMWAGDRQSWGTERGMGIPALTSDLWHKHVFQSEIHALYEILKFFHGLWIFTRVSPCEEGGRFEGWHSAPQRARDTRGRCKPGQRSERTLAVDITCGRPQTQADLRGCHTALYEH